MALGDQSKKASATLGNSTRPSLQQPVAIDPNDVFSYSHVTLKMAGKRVCTVIVPEESKNIIRCFYLNLYFQKSLSARDL